MKIKNLEQANETLREIAELQRILAVAEAALNGKIDGWKAAARDKAVPLQAKLAELEKAVQVYAEYNRQEIFTERKSVVLSFGSFGFRSSTALKTMSKWTWEKVLTTLKSLGGKGAVRIKEEVNRETLSAWEDDELAAVGVRRETKETFWIEIAEQEIGKETAA